MTTKCILLYHFYLKNIFPIKFNSDSLIENKIIKQKRLNLIILKDEGLLHLQKII